MRVWSVDRLITPLYLDSLSDSCLPAPQQRAHVFTLQPTAAMLPVFMRVAEGDGI